MKDCTGLADANSLKLRPSFATTKIAKPYNRTHIGTRQECVFAEGNSHRSICLFTFCAWHKILQRRAENVKPYHANTTLADIQHHWLGKRVVTMVFKAIEGTLGPTKTDSPVMVKMRKKWSCPCG